METTSEFTPESSPTLDENSASLDGRQRLIVVGAVVFVILLIAGAVGLAVLLVSNPEQTETLRDVFIIFMALEFLLIGLTLIILIIQVARLTALLQNEIQPILQSTSETVKTLRGTTTFLSQNLVQPVMKANSSLAAVRRALKLFKGGRG